MGLEQESGISTQNPCEWVAQLCISDGTARISVQGWIEYDIESGIEVWKDVKIIGVENSSDYSVSDAITEIPVGFFCEPCQYNVTQEEVASTTRCFLSTYTDPSLEIPALNVAAVDGHETLTGYLWETAQFSSPTLSDFDAIDADGVQWSAGEHAVIDTASLASNASTLSVYSGYIHIPEFYHTGANSGKRAELCLYSSGAGEADICIATKNGQPSLDRSDIVSTGDGKYCFPTAWAGQNIRVMLKGAGAVSWRAEIVFDDGTATLTNQDARDWMWNETSTPPTIAQIQEKYEQRYDGSTGQYVWFGPDGTQVALSNIAVPLQEVGCDWVSMSCDVVAIGGSTTISNPSGGSGGPYKVTLDGGITSHNLPYTYDLGDTSDGTEPDIVEIRPQIVDSEGITSPVKSPAVLVGDPTDESQQSLVLDDGNLATSSADPEAVGGYTTDYGILLYDGSTKSGDFTINTTTGTVADQGNQWVTFNSGNAGVGGIDSTICFDGSVGPDGENGKMVVDLQSVYYSAGSDVINIKITPVDSSGAVIGSAVTIKDDNSIAVGSLADISWPHNSFQNSSLELDLVHTGNDVCLRVEDSSTGSDSSDHYWRMNTGSVDIYDGGIQTSSSHLYQINNSYIEARGVDTTVTGPTYIHRSVDDVSDMDVVTLIADVDRAGGFDWGSDPAYQWALQYSLDGGPWIDDLVVTDNWNSAGSVYTKPYYSAPIDVSSAQEMQVRICVEGGGNNSAYLRLVDLKFDEVQA